MGDPLPGAFFYAGIERTFRLLPKRVFVTKISFP